jgi:hypothetical protein
MNINYKFDHFRMNPSSISEASKKDNDKEKL